jgi:hypothetical protein
MPNLALRPLRLAVVTLLVAACSSAPTQPAATAPAPVTSGTPAGTSGTAGYVKEFGTMWTFDAPPLAYWAERYGFRPDAVWLDHVRLAAVRLPNCSASFVSAQGLVLTNHHCGRSCISSASPTDTNYQETGFVARRLQDEKPCSGLWLDQLESIEDVTPRVRAAVTAPGAARQAQQNDSVARAIEGECQRASGLTCQVVSFYQGGMYSLYRYRRFSDVRLVFAPEGQAAFFGGDPDNFTYPRYDLDVTMLRVYEDSAPRKTDHFLPWNAAGARDGEPVFVIGNPGSTGRLLTVAQMEYLRDVQYPYQLASLRRTLEVYRTLAQQNDANRRRYENQIFGFENSIKAITGYRSGLLDSTIMARKRSFEGDFRTRVGGDPALRPRHGAAWDAIAAAERALAAVAPVTTFHGFGGSQLLGAAGGIVRLPAQAALPDSLRLSQYWGSRPRPPARPGAPRGRVRQGAGAPDARGAAARGTGGAAPGRPLRAGGPRGTHAGGRGGRADRWDAARRPGRAPRAGGGRSGGGGGIVGPAHRGGEGHRPPEPRRRRAGRAVEREHRGERRAHRPGHFCGVWQGAPARCDLHPADLGRGRGRLPDERDRGAVQDDPVRALRALG